MQDTSAASRDGAILVVEQSWKFEVSQLHRDLLMIENALLKHYAEWALTHRKLM